LGQTKPEVYVSVDIESDGPIPGPHSMLSLGAAAFDTSGKMLGTFSQNFNPLISARADDDTMTWWLRPENKAAYQATYVDRVEPEVGMRHFYNWVRSLPGKPVFVGYPAGFDFLFVYWYLRRFVGDSPFSFSALDVKTYAASVLKIPYREATKRNMPKRWFSDSPHTHVAVDDAIEQGRLFMNMFLENTNGKTKGQ